jgi:hypothetical protein
MSSQHPLEARVWRETLPYVRASETGAPPAPNFPSFAQRTLPTKSTLATRSFSILCKRVRISQKTINFKFLCLHTHAHSFPGSPAFSALYAFGTGGIPPRRHRNPKVPLEIRQSAATKLTPSSAYRRHRSPASLPEIRQFRQRHNRRSRAKIKTAFAAPESLGYGSGLAETVGIALFISPQRPKTL